MVISLAEEMLLLCVCVRRTHDIDSWPRPLSTSKWLSCYSCGWLNTAEWFTGLHYMYISQTKTSTNLFDREKRVTSVHFWVATLHNNCVWFLFTPLIKAKLMELYTPCVDKKSLHLLLDDDVKEIYPVISYNHHSYCTIQSNLHSALTSLVLSEKLARNIQLQF